MFSTLWTGQRSTPRLVVEPDVPRSKELNSSLSGCDALLFKDRSDACLVIDLCQFVILVSNVGGDCGEAVVRRVDELSDSGYGFEVKFSDIWHLELPREEFGVSGGGDISDVPNSRVGIALVDSDLGSTLRHWWNVFPLFPAVGWTSCRDFDGVRDAHCGRFVFVARWVNLDRPVALAPCRAGVLQEFWPSGKRLCVI